jgi:hypothetical protein
MIKTANLNIRIDPQTKKGAGQRKPPFQQTPRKSPLFTLFPLLLNADLTDTESIAVVKYD